MKIIRNFDVGSYYPHLMTINGYTSRNIPTPKIFEDVLESRMKAKAEGRTKQANSKKLVCNTTYGATLNQYNALYDPLMARSVCISGQLYLLQLACHLHQVCKTLNIVQLNTDGIMVIFDDSEYGIVKDVTAEWQKRTGFELQEDVITQIIQKDVNNYVEVQQGGKAKAKGGYLVRGISPAGAFNINNNACVVAKAIREYFLHDTDPADTINAETDILQFQQIAKAGAKYRQAYHLVDGQKVPVQKVNRVYATTDERYGRLYKVKAETDGEAKIDSLPEHCLIDNEGTATIDMIDRTFYIDMARKRINDFMGIKPEKKGRKTMATAKSTTNNVWSKLLTARIKFLNSGAEKTGKNTNLKFRYFELDDIVPVAEPIFAEVGLAHVINITNDTAVMTMVNVDAPEEQIEFSVPFREPGVITSNSGRDVTNPCQSLGSGITYIRRYLYSVALDICEPDDVDAHLGDKPSPLAPATAPVAPAAPVKPVVNLTSIKPNAPVTEEKREEIKQELTAADGPIDALQLDSFKSALKALIAKNQDKGRRYGAKLATETKGYTEMTKVVWEKAMADIAKMMEE